MPLLIGSAISKTFHRKQYFHTAIIHKGIMLVLISSTLFIFFVNSQIISPTYAEQSTILSYSFIFMCIIGVAMIIPNSLSHALEDYGEYTGTAASLFGFYYYCVVAIMTTLMSILHNGQLLQLPLFLFIQGLTMLIIFNLTLSTRKTVEVSNANI